MRILPHLIAGIPSLPKHSRSPPPHPPAHPPPGLCAPSTHPCRTPELPQAASAPPDPWATRRSCLRILPPRTDFDPSFLRSGIKHVEEFAKYGIRSTICGSPGLTEEDYKNLIPRREPPTSPVSSLPSRRPDPPSMDCISHKRAFPPPRASNTAPPASPSPAPPHKSCMIPPPLALAPPPHPRSFRAPSPSPPPHLCG